MTNFEATEFAGKYLTLNTDGFLMMALLNRGESESGLQFTGTLAIPVRDAFLAMCSTTVKNAGYMLVLLPQLMYALGVFAGFPGCR